MLSYQHLYHAGNFADVHKHIALLRLLRARYGEPIAPGGDPVTPARFTRSTDGGMRVEQVFQFGDSLRIELRGERISNAVVVGCRR